MAMRYGEALGAALLGVLAAGTPAVAQTYTWDGGGTTNNWNTAANWASPGNDVLPNPGQNSIIQFAGTTRLTPVQNVASPFELNQLVFTTTAGAFNLTGNPLLFRGNTSSAYPKLIQNSATAITIANDIRIESGSPLFVQGTGSGNVTLNGPIIGATNTIEKYGNHTLVLGRGDNTTWNGKLQVSGGIVRTAAQGALNGVNVDVDRGGTLNLNGFSQTITGLTLYNLFGSTSAPFGPQVSTGSGTLTLAGNVNYVPASSGSSPAAIISGRIDLGTATRTFNIENPTTGGIEFITDATIASGFNGYVVVKTGTGKWLVRNGGFDNVSVYINDGEIITGKANVLSRNASLTMRGNGRLTLGYDTGSEFEFFDQRIGGLISEYTTTNVQLGSATLTINVAFAANDFSYSGTLDSFGERARLVKIGAGTQTLTGNNFFAGGLEVHQGTIAVPIDAALGLSNGGFAPSVTVKAGGAIRYTENAYTQHWFDLTNGGSITVDSGKWVTYRFDANVQGGFLKGFGTHILDGTRMAGTTVMPGTNVSAGAGTTLTNVTVGGNLIANWGDTLTWDGGSLAGSGNMFVGAGTTLNVSHWTSSGVTTIAGGADNTGGRLNNSGNPLVLGGGSRTYVGSTTVRGGTINLGGQTLELNGGLLANNSNLVSSGSGGVQGGIVNVNYGSTITGSGWFDEVVVNYGGSDRTGNSIANTLRGSQTLNSGSSYEFEINRANGTPGGGGTTPPVGWDLLTLTTAFTVNASAASPAIIQLVSRNAADTGAGSLPDFDPTQAYQWLMFRVNSSGTVNGFEAEKFVIDTSAFANLTDPTGVGTFELIRIGNDISLSYSPVPEPACVLAIAAAALGGVWFRRRVVRPL